MSAEDTGLSNVPKIEKAEVISVDNARQVLSQEDHERRQRFNDGLVQLSRETGYQVAPCVIFPGDEVIALASFLKAFGIEAQPHIQIVRGRS